MPTWDPAQYEQFADQRLRPARELLARVPLERPARVVDLGCGTGNVTRLLRERFPDADVLGLDSSAEMLEKARATAPGVRWSQADIDSWAPEEAPDLIYSNAALHWLAGHEALLPRLFGALAPGGCLAVQMPLSWSLPSHVLMREVLASGGPCGRSLGTASLRERAAQRPVAEPATYYDLVARAAAAVDVWTTEYLQQLEGPDPVLEWVRGTGLRPILEGLEGAERDRFLEVYGARLAEAYPARPDGRTLYPFRRLFLIGLRP